MVLLLNSQGMKNCKSTESFCLSILTIYTSAWSTSWHVYCCRIYFVFCEIPKYLQVKNNFLSPLTGWPTWTGFLWKWASMLTELAGKGECRLARFHEIKNFLATETYDFSRLYHQTGCLFKWATHSI